MTTFTTDPTTETRPHTPRFAPRAVLARLRGALKADPTERTAADAEEVRARRAFVMERLNDNPDAFATAYDVHAMMSLYPRQF